MAGWFTKLMQQTHAGARPTSERDARFDAVVRALRDREAENRVAREKRQRWYKQILPNEAHAHESSAASGSARLHRFRANVPCRITPEAQALLSDLRKQFAGGTIAFRHVTARQHAVLLTPRSGAEPKQIGWLEQRALSDASRGSDGDRGLSVETDGDAMLLLRFSYRTTPVTVVSNRSAENPALDFAEVCTALEMRSMERVSPPRLVWVTRPELEMMRALESRDYESFYVRFKLEVMAGIWISLSALLANAPVTQWHEGTHYTLTRDADASNRRISQKSIDDTGRTVDIGSDVVYDAASATDILLLYLEEDILADVADIYFTLAGLDSTESYFLKEEFFNLIRRFWGSAPSLVSCYGSDLETVLRMSLRASPKPTQVALLKQDWSNLRQLLLDRYGESGRNAPRLATQPPRPGPAVWPFALSPSGDINLGLRVVYRQDANQEGEAEKIAGCGPDVTKWPRDADGAINLGVRGLTARAELDRESEIRGISTRSREVQNVVMIAEKLPAPAEIDVAWVRRHGWMLSAALLDASFRVALESISEEVPSARERAADADVELAAQRERLFEHIRDNILHYQRAIWQQEDPQQRAMRYRKWARKVPLEWRFELETGASLTVDQLADRLSCENVDGQFAAYSDGRQADLDQVIDSAGPVGYFGNYAIYRMRPEFGSADCFPMLHFFKPVPNAAEEESGVEADDERILEEPPPEECRLILDDDWRDSAAVVANGYRGSDVARAPVRIDESEKMLMTGRTDDSKVARLILASRHRGPKRAVAGGGYEVHAREVTIAARNDARLKVPQVGTATGHERVIVSAGTETLRPSPIARAG